MKSDNTPDDNLQSSWRIMQKLARIFSSLRSLVQCERIRSDDASKSSDAGMTHESSDTVQEESDYT